MLLSFYTAVNEPGHNGHCSSRFGILTKNYGRSIIQSGREVYLAVGLNQSAVIPGGAPRLHQSELQHCRQTD